MKYLVAVVLFVAVAQAKYLADLQPRNIYVTPNPRHTAEEWDAIYAAAVANIPENTTGLVPGTTRQPVEAGKVFVEPADRIVSGSVAAQGQIPWQAMVILDQNILCGGSLISREWVLTAAHCLHGVSSYQITLGSTSRTSAQAGSVSQNGRQGVIHSNYNNSNGANDIGAVRLTSAVTLTNHINVIRLPSSASNTFAGSSGIVSGFGGINGLNTSLPEYLMYANVEVIANTVCARTFGTIIQPYHICSIGSGGRSPCRGDSGGPLAVHDSGTYTLVGIVSFTAVNCPADAPAGYTRVTSYLSWISSTTGVIL